MTVAVAPQDAETPLPEGDKAAPKVLVLLTVVEGADLDAALSVLGRQVYQPEPEVVVVGGDRRDDVRFSPDLESAIGEADQSVDYLWILHSDARPRPDALRALVAEVDRNEAALGGSKLLVAGTPDVLESVGSATDVFGEPYSGLEEGEIDLQQYDVVREVAFVRSASMLVRRDIAQGLRGLDELLPPIAAGLDFSQRTRLAGGKVISVPSSEVYHQGRCDEGEEGWRERAGRLRAMLTAYRPLTLLWVVPFDLLVSLLHSIGSLLLGRWRPAVNHLASWLWNLAHIASTIRLRSRTRKIRVSGDEELFRFQARGSVRLREVGTELSGKVLGLFDDDQALARGAKRVWAAPGIWGAVIGGLIAIFAARSLLFAGMPNAGASMPFESPLVALDRWFGGWNDAGLGSPAPVHPSTLLTAVLSVVAFGATGAARTMATVLTVGVGIVGMGRLGGRLGLRGPGRYLSGLVLMGGPGTALLAGTGSWNALVAASILPWLVRAVMVPDNRAGAGTFGWPLVLGVPLAALEPALLPVPLILGFLLSSSTVRLRRVARGAVALAAGAVAIPFILGDPAWLVDSGRRLGLAPTTTWVAVIAAAAATTSLLPDRWRRVSAIGGVVSLGALLVLVLPIGGPGVESALLITASLGAALVTSAGLDLLSAEPLRLVSVFLAVTLIGLSVGGGLANGRYGLASGDLHDRYGFAEVLSEDSEPGRVLIVSTDRAMIPGEARSGPGFWHRLVDASGMTHDEVWLPESLPGDEALSEALELLAAGGELRPGEVLAPFAVDWLVIEGPETVLDSALIGQLDLLPTPLATGARVYENLSRQPLAGAWQRSGTGYAGEPLARVRLAVNISEGWQPDPVPEDWALTVDGQNGRADFSSPGGALALVTLGPIAFLVGLGLIVFGRRKR